LSYSVTWNSSVLKWRVEFVRPWGSVAVAVSVVVAEQVIAAGLLTARNLEWDVDSGEEIFGKVRREREKV
jgi:hypothetical protein